MKRRSAPLYGPYLTQYLPAIYFSVFTVAQFQLSRLTSRSLNRRPPDSEISGRFVLARDAKAKLALIVAVSVHPSGPSVCLSATA